MSSWGTWRGVSLERGPSGGGGGASPDEGIPARRGIWPEWGGGGGQRVLAWREVPAWRVSPEGALRLGPGFWPGGGGHATAGLTRPPPV